MSKHDAEFYKTHLYEFCVDILGIDPPPILRDPLILQAIVKANSKEPPPKPQDLNVSKGQDVWIMSDDICGESGLVEKDEYSDKAVIDFVTEHVDASGAEKLSIWFDQYATWIRWKEKQ